VRESARARTDSQETERADGGCCDCASKRAPWPICRGKWVATRDRVCVCDEVLCHFSLAGGGQEAHWPGGAEGARTPHGQTEPAKKGRQPLTRADRSVSKGQRDGHGGRQKRAKGKRPRVHGQTENGKKEGRGPDTRADRNRQRALGRQLTQQRVGTQVPGTW